MLRRLLELYACSWVLVLTHAFCVVLGVVLMFAAAVGALEASGLRVTAELLR